MGRRGVYTPEMVVAGLDDVVGNRRQAVMAAIAARAKADRSRVSPTIAVARRKGRFEVTVSGKVVQPATVWLMPTLSHTVVSIGHGENRGATLGYTNVVRAVEEAGIWHGGHAVYDVTPPEKVGTYDAVAVLVQEHGYGHVLGGILMPLH